MSPNIVCAGGWVYLAIVINACGRRVVSWSIADHMRDEPVAGALTWPPGNFNRPGSGCVQAPRIERLPWLFGKRLRASGLLGSLRTVGDRLDNPVAGSLLALLR
jgi:putative transposase